MDVAVAVDSLSVRYGDVVAVEALSFTAAAGRVTCVLGPNGAGKTSTIECLEGLRRPSAGRTRVLGLDPRHDHRALAPRIGVMLQEGGVHPAVRVGEALRHGAALYPRALDVAALVDRLGLAGLERRAWRRLSGGEQRRVALGLALVGRPEVAFLDEPTAGVDVAGRQVVREVIGELRADGVAVLVTTHDLDEAERIADDVVVVDRGRLVAAGSLDELVGAAAGPGGTGAAAAGPGGVGAGADVVRFSAPAGLDTAALGAHLGGAVVVTVDAAGRSAGTAGGAGAGRPGRYEVAVAPTPANVAAITAWLAERDLALSDLQAGAGRQRLEDVFLRLTSEPAALRGAGTRSVGASRRAET